MTATDELRRMLDERGVEYETYIEQPTGFEHVKWNFNEHGSADFNLEFGEPWLTMYGVISGPEQAIAATLGRGTCRNVAVPDEYSDRPFTCSECGARGPMGNGTYHLASSWAMEDGTLAFGDSWPVWKYCPNCGRKVVADG